MRLLPLKTRLLACGVSPLILSMMPLNIAYAQEQQATAETGNDGVQEIVVTAQRRSEALKDVPLSVQAISPRDLGRGAINDTSDLALISPTLNFTTGNSASAQGIALRGVSSVALQNGIQPSVAIVVDGVPISRQSEFIINLGDIQRIEILNGPQGTLFGKNATAGVVNIVTQQPTSKFEGRVEGLATTDAEFGIKAMLNAPISEKVRLRLNGFYHDQNPIVRNFTANDIIGVKDYGASAKLAVDLGDTATYTLAATYSHTNSSNGQYAQVLGNVFGPLYESTIAPAKIGRGQTSINTDTNAVDLYQSLNFTGTLNWKLSDNLDLTAITGYTTFREDSNLDGDLSPKGLKIGKGFTLPSVYYPFVAVDSGLKGRFPIRFHYVSQEIRANYHTDKLNLIIGGYFQDYRDHFRLRLQPLIDGALAGLPAGTLYFSSNVPEARIHDTTMAVFGDATYSITPQIKLFAGLRFTHEKIDMVYHRENFFGPASFLDIQTGAWPLPTIEVVDRKEGRGINNLSGRAGLQYQPTSNLNFYATYARGFKAPGVNVGQTLTATQNPIVDPEKASSYEIGAKLRLFDNRMAVNVALFDQTIKGIQTAALIPGGIIFNPTLINAGNLHTKGLEGDVELRVDRHLRLSGGLAYNDATYGNFAFACSPEQTATITCPNYKAPGFQNIKGNQAITSPKWKYHLAADYTGEFAQNGWGYYLHTDWTWTSPIQFGLDNSALTREPGHGMLNASVGITSDHFDFQVFAKNLTNKFFYSNLISAAPIGLPTGYIPRDYKRYGGVRVAYHF